MRFVNTGTVGRPDDGDPRACYALMGIAGGQVDVRHYRVAYDVARAAAAIRAAGHPEALELMMEQGRGLDAVLGPPQK